MVVLWIFIGFGFLLFAIFAPGLLTIAIIIEVIITALCVKLVASLFLEDVHMFDCLKAVILAATLFILSAFILIPSLASSLGIVGVILGLVAPYPIAVFGFTHSLRVSYFHGSIIAILCLVLLSIVGAVLQATMLAGVKIF